MTTEITTKAEYDRAVAGLAENKLKMAQLRAELEADLIAETMGDQKLVAQATPLAVKGETTVGRMVRTSIAAQMDSLFGPAPTPAEAPAPSSTGPLAAKLQGYLCSDE